MNTSVRWLNDYLDPPATAEEQANALTLAGFPVERTEEVSLPGGLEDVRQDIELTSNRGDCLCHVGLAREIAAVSGRTLKPPAAVLNPSGADSQTILKVENHDAVSCPLYTARIIRGVRVGPSPAWIQERLLARGDIPRNNLVDASNFVLFELGQPTHIFDLATLRGQRILVRRAMAGEHFQPIGEGAAALRLHCDDLVIADAERAIALAGVKGGSETAVTNSTRDIVIEAASFAPATVRASGRRHGIVSDAAYRFERGVSPAQVDDAADRLVDLILQTCGGELCGGAIRSGRPIPAPKKVQMRCERCRQIIGLPITDEQMRESLARLDLQPHLALGVLECTLPPCRLDLEREIDLVEEVARLTGLEHVPVADSMPVRVAPPQATELARRAVNDALVGMGFIETVTHSLIGEQAADLFLPPGMTALKIEDERAGSEPVLRPSILPSLLRVLARNRDTGATDVRLFEAASTFALLGDQHIERVNLAMVQSGDGLRELRGAIDRLVQIVFGDAATVIAEPQHIMPWFAPGAVLRVGEDILGLCGVLSPQVMRAFGLPGDAVGAEIGLPQHYHRYPPATEARALPAFPAIERDISVIIDDRTSWSAVRAAVESLRLNHLESVEFVTVFRGRQISPGRKSLTLRLRFRAPDHTLTHDAVDPQSSRVMDMLRATFAAEIRT